MSTLDRLLSTLEEALGRVEELDEPVRGDVFALLDGIDALHRVALARLIGALEPATVARLRDGDPAIAWLLDAYGLGIDQKAAADAAVNQVRPYIESHGGEVEVIDAHDGVVRVRLAGACVGCTASAVTLRHGVEQSLRDGFAGFVRLDVEEQPGVPHPPPGPTLLQIEPRWTPSQS